MSRGLAVPFLANLRSMGGIPCVRIAPVRMRPLNGLGAYGLSPIVLQERAWFEAKYRNVLPGPRRLETLTGRIVSGRYLQQRLAASITVYRNSLLAEAGSSLSIVTVLNANSMGLVGVFGAWFLSGHVTCSPSLINSWLAVLLYRSVSLQAMHLGGPCVPSVSASKQVRWHLVSQYWHRGVGSVRVQGAWQDPHIIPFAVLCVCACGGGGVFCAWVAHVSPVGPVVLSVLCVGADVSAELGSASSVAFAAGTLCGIAE